MNRRQTFASLGLALLLAVGTASPTSGQQQRQSDAQIRQTMIRQSIANYPGSCPCPYSTARNGSRCGGRSA